MPNPPSVQAVLSAAITDPGRKRQLNEDAVTQSITSYGGVFVVADGMGGHKTGEVASRMAIDRITEVVNRSAPSPKALLEAFDKANGVIFEAGQRPESRGMGTTATALWLDLPYALVAHVGDSRAYMLRKGQPLTQLTQDHSWVAERVRQGVLNEEEAKTHRWRNVITNALGSFPNSRVDIVGFKIELGDTFLLCSDGLSGVLDDKVLTEVLETSAPEEAANKLVQLANEWGGPDNISVVVVQIVSLPTTTASKPYALPLEAAAGSPVSLQSTVDPEVLNNPTLESEAPKSLWGRWGNFFLLILWIALLGYVLYSQFGRVAPAGP
jgi:protein phosphatase